MSRATCSVCGGPTRITVLRPTPVDPLCPPGVVYLIDPAYAWSALIHCRAHPEHSLGEPFEAVIAGVRAQRSPEAWAADDPHPDGVMNDPGRLTPE